MANKELQIMSEHDALLAEMIVTLRAGFGMEPGAYNPQTGMLEIPDDYAMAKKPSKSKRKGKDKKAEAEKPKEPEAEKPAEEPKVPEPKDK